MSAEETFAAAVNAIRIETAPPRMLTQMPRRQRLSRITSRFQEVVMLKATEISVYPTSLVHRAGQTDGPIDRSQRWVRCLAVSESRHHSIRSVLSPTSKN